MQIAIVSICGTVLLIAAVALAICVGSVSLPFSMVVKSVSGMILQTENMDTAAAIIVDLRLPRALLALIVGAGLGIAGCLLQTVVRNDLADPFLFGLSSGAAAGAIFVITVTGDLFGFWTLPVAAFSGGMIASGVVLTLVVRMGDQGRERLILAGLAVSFLFLAFTNYMIFVGDQRGAHSVLFWTLGGLGLARWDLLPIALTGLSIIITFALVWSRPLDAFMAGELTAKTLGVNVTLLRKLVFLVCAFSTATFVSIAGVIGFVGLMVPHLARILVGPLHTGLVIVSALLGAGLLLVSDIIARTIAAPQELPIGIVTTAIGAIFILLFLNRKTGKT